MPLLRLLQHVVAEFARCSFVFWLFDNRGLTNHSVTMFGSMLASFLQGQPEKPKFDKKDIEHIIYIDTEGNGGFFGSGGGISRPTYDTFIEQYRHYDDDDDLVIHIRTEGGSLTYATLIAHIVAAHSGKTTARVTRYAMSGGTLIALACDSIEMTKYATLGGIDPQSSTYGSVRNVRPHLVNWGPELGSWASLFRAVALTSLSEIESSFGEQVGRIFGERYSRDVLHFFTKKHSHETPLLRAMLPEELNVALYTEPPGAADVMKPLTAKQILKYKMEADAMSSSSDDEDEVEDEDNDDDSQ